MTGGHFTAVLPVHGPGGLPPGICISIQLSKSQISDSFFIFEWLPNLLFKTKLIKLTFVDNFIFILWKCLPSKAVLSHTCKSTYFTFLTRPGIVD